MERRKLLSTLAVGEDYAFIFFLFQNSDGALHKQVFFVRRQRVPLVEVGVVGGFDEALLAPISGELVVESLALLLIHYRLLVNLLVGILESHQVRPLSYFVGKQ